MLMFRDEPDEPGVRPYYWWFQYLRNSAAYETCCNNGGTGICASLYATFGDVRRISFSGWWSGHAKLFQPLEPFLLDAIETRAQFRVYEASPDSAVVLAVNMYAPKRELQRAFHAWLRSNHKGKRGRPPHSDCTAEFFLDRRVNVHGLRRTLEVYCFRRSHPELTLWKIGEIFGMCKGNELTGEDDQDRADKKLVLAAAASRYVRYAEAIIFNVAFGIFPRRNYEYSRQEVKRIAETTGVKLKTYLRSAKGY